MKEKRDMPPPRRFQYPLDRRYFTMHPKGRRKYEGMNFTMLAAHDYWRDIK